MRLLGALSPNNNGPQGRNDPQSAVGFARQEFFNRHRFPMLAKLQGTRFNSAKRYRSFEDEAKGKQ
jgi:hypothetical protein